MIKILLKLDERDWHLSSGETVWAETYQNKGNLFIINNTPFFAKGVSYLDVVNTRFENGGYIFVSVEQSGGHSTYRLMVDPDTAVFGEYWKRLDEMGCTYERSYLAHGRVLYAVDVPPAANIRAVYELLQDGERKKVWIFEEGNVGHALIG